ncbi:MAG: secretin [Thermotogae bacterium]|nr:MAG: secretin [Thermotogota bacterium]
MKSKKIIFVLILIISSIMIAEEVEQQPLVTNIFQNTFILDALSDISAQTGVTIIADTTVSGFVTLELNEVPLEKALKMILMPGGYIFVKIDDFYFVGAPDPKNPAFRFLAESEVFKLHYITAKSAKELLPSIYNSFIKIDEQTNTITITAPRSFIERFKEDLAKIDVPIRQIKISVLVTEVSKDVVGELGINSLDLSLNAGQSINEDWTSVLGLVLGSISFETDVFGNIVSKIKLLEGEQKAKVTADPWIIVSDGKKANLFVGKRHTVVLETGRATSRTESIDVGVSLEIIPRIVNDGEIELTLSPKISHFVGERSGLFSVKRSDLSTTIYVKDGQTIMISGITVKEESDSYQGIPILGQIPLLRYLFGGKTKSGGERELMIFITTEIL